jgi:hypothetical protein
MNPPRSVNGQINTIEIQGLGYEAKTQKIIVTDSYTNKTISYIVDDLFSQYVPWVTRTGIETCSKVITIRFPDTYLWDAMEQLCTIAGGYDWDIDENLDVSFFAKGSRINATILSQASLNYKRGTAKLAPDATKIVNRLWVKGSFGTSDPFTQNITAGTDPIPLFYSPRSPVTATIGGVVKTLGIQNIDAAGTKDFLLNANEKLLIPDLVTSGTGTIIYCYEYPIKILLEDLESQARYGIFEDVYKADVTDKTLAREMGLQYLAKYSNPVISGSIEPMAGAYKPGELIKVTIPGLNIDDYLQIREVRYESLNRVGRVNRYLTLQSTERDTTSILKDLSNRLAKLEASVYNDDEGLVEKYTFFADKVISPVFVDDGLTWHTHRFLACGTVASCTNLAV